MLYRPFSKILQLFLLIFVIIVAVGAGDPAAGADAGARFDKLGHRIMCPCGCNELLGECNHVGCPDSDKMRTQLMASIKNGDSNDTIFHDFQNEYGPTALAAPMFTSFNHVAWIMPPLVLLLGIGGVFLVVRKWKFRTVPMPVVAHTPRADALRNRIRQDTEL